jgi:Asp-tRNA(Asn)/Glu-tRNA(Gln) amidotransferase A subunit family amidase
MVAEHAVTRSMRDSAALLRATQRCDAGAPFPPLSAEALAPAARPRRLRIGVYERTGSGLVPHPEVGAALADARALCERLGHDTLDTPGPRFDAVALRDAFFLLAGFALGVLAPGRPADELITFTEVLAGYTAVASAAGAPAMSVPLGSSVRGLPIGCHFTAAPGEEALLFQLAYALEEAAPWQGRRPAVSALPPGPEGACRSA